MYTSTNKKKESKSQSVANSISQRNHEKTPFQLVDNRPNSISEKKLQPKTNHQQEPVVQQQASSKSTVIQRFPWGKSIGVPALGILGNFIAPGIGGFIGAGIGALAGHYYDTSPTKPKGNAPQKPNNMTDVHVNSQYFHDDVDDHKDRLGADNTDYNGLSNFEQQYLGINTQNNTMTSSLHPQTLNDLGMRLNTLTGIADDSRGQQQMSPQGRAHDTYTSKKLIYDGATAGKSKTHANHPHAKEVLGELHHLPDKRQKLANDLQQGNAKDSLYLELNQEIQPLVDHYKHQYAQDNTTQMPKLLKGYLKRIDDNFRLQNQRNQEQQQYPAQGQAGTYEHLVDSHVKAGKNVVFADSPYVKGLPHDKNFEYNREAGMNQAMYEKITQDQNQNPSSYTVLTGEAHVGNNRHGLQKITGLKDRLGA